MCSFEGHHFRRFLRSQFSTSSSKYSSLMPLRSSHILSGVSFKYSLIRPRSLRSRYSNCPQVLYSSRRFILLCSLNFKSSWWLVLLHRSISFLTMVILILHSVSIPYGGSLKRVLFQSYHINSFFLFLSYRWFMKIFASSRYIPF